MLTIEKGSPPLARVFVSLDSELPVCPDEESGSMLVLRFDSRLFPSSPPWGRLRGDVRGRLISFGGFLTMILSWTMVWYLYIRRWILIPRETISTQLRTLKR